MREWNGRNWKLFDLNIIAHLLVKRIFEKSANFEKYSLRFFFRFVFDFCLAAKPLSGKRRSADVLCHPQGRILA